VAENTHSQMGEIAVPLRLQTRQHLHRNTCAQRQIRSQPGKDRL